MGLAGKNETNAPETAEERKNADVVEEGGGEKQDR